MKNILIIGATSAIAEQYARLEAVQGSRFLLAARSSQRLQIICADLAVRGAEKSAHIAFDVNHFDQHDSLLDAAWSHLGNVDVVLVAHGTLPDQKACETDISLALHEFSTNATATIAIMAAVSQRLERQGKGTLVVISSVAGDRGRASNYLYGSAKAAVTAFSSGLRQHLYSTGINVLTIKPGFVDTPMTHAFKKGPLWASPRSVAAGIAKAIERRKSVVYLPGFWWWIMRVITHMPETLFRRIKL